MLEIVRSTSCVFKQSLKIVTTKSHVVCLILDASEGCGIVETSVRLYAPTSDADVVLTMTVLLIPFIVSQDGVIDCPVRVTV